MYRKYDPIEKVIETCVKHASDMLIEHGIRDPFTVKLKKLKNKNWLALYRSNTQFSSEPIIWININLYDIFRKQENYERKKYGDSQLNEYIVITDNILHEYGHVIAEWGRVRNPKIEAIVASFGSEEDFAEGFKDFIRDGFSTYGNYSEVIRLFKKDINSGQQEL